MTFPSVCKLFLVITLAATLSMTQSVNDSIRSRRLVYFGPMDSLQYALTSSGPALISNVSRKKAVSRHEEHGEEEEDSSRLKMWPPWPFNLLTQPRRTENGRDSSIGYRSSGLFWAYFRQQLQSTKRQMQHGERDNGVTSALHNLSEAYLLTKPFALQSGANFGFTCLPLELRSYCWRAFHRKGPFQEMED